MLAVSSDRGWVCVASKEQHEGQELLCGAQGHRAEHGHCQPGHTKVLALQGGAARLGQASQLFFASKKPNSSIFRKIKGFCQVHVTASVTDRSH